MFPISIIVIGMQFKEMEKTFSELSQIFATSSLYEEQYGLELGQKHHPLRCEKKYKAS